MILPRASASSSGQLLRFAATTSGYSRTPYARTSALRNISTQCQPNGAYIIHQRRFVPGQLPPASPLLFSSTLQPAQSLTRLFSSHAALFEQARKPEDVKDPPRTEGEASAKSESTGEGESRDEQSDEGKEKKKAPPPPPPHGDKTPWQVFRDTLQAEFKASKEWNDSTKQLGGAVQSFTESEAVRKAREMSEQATSRTGTAFKTTGKALGQGAAWTWDTSVVQGFRKGVNATGRGIEKATRPVRETKAFKEISNAVDDGSSSRYGGWVEKEERRKQKELRDLEEIKSGRRVEKLEEDPK